MEGLKDYATGKALREARRRTGLTQKQFGKLLGVHWVTVSKWERGHEPLPNYAKMFSAMLHDDQSLAHALEAARRFGFLPPEAQE